MSERKLYGKFKEKMQKADLNCWVYKIPDFPLGGKRPFDFILVMKGVPFAIEFKSEEGTLKKYQGYQLQKFIIAEGESLIYWEGRDNMDSFINKIIKIVKKRKNSNVV